MFSMTEGQEGPPPEIQSVLDEYSDVFGDPSGPVQRDVTHQIDLINEEAPVPRPRLYRMS